MTVSRSRWGGGTPQKVHYILVPVEYVIITQIRRECRYEKECRQIVEETRREHMEFYGLNDIAYK